MIEPKELPEQLHVLCLYSGRTYIVTREQAIAITAAQNSSEFKTVSIGNCPITLNQISDIPTLDVYRRQMKTTLALKGQRMCRRCGAIVAIQDRCSCRENRSPSVYETAAKENPNLKLYLESAGYGALALPEPKEPEPLLLPPTPKEREQMRVIQGYKDRFLGRSAVVPLPDCATCKNKREYEFKGTVVKCDCVLAGRRGFTRPERSGIVQPPVPPSV